MSGQGWRDSRSRKRPWRDEERGRKRIQHTDTRHDSASEPPGSLRYRVPRADDLVRQEQRCSFSKVWKHTHTLHTATTTRKHRATRRLYGYSSCPLRPVLLIGLCCAIRLQPTEIGYFSKYAHDEVRFDRSNLVSTVNERATLLDVSIEGATLLIVGCCCHWRHTCSSNTRSRRLARTSCMGSRVMYRKKS